MKQGKHVVQKQPRRVSGRSSSMLIALLLIAVFAVSGTLAYLVAHTAPVKNTFLPGSITPEIHEEVGGGVKSSVKIQNTGNSSAYIRAAVIGNTIDEAGNVTGTFEVGGYLCGSGWTKGTDGFYYWTEKVAPMGQSGDTTGELLTGSIELEGKQVIVLAEAIQCEPAEALNAAQWGWTPAA